MNTSIKNKPLILKSCVNVSDETLNAVVDSVKFMNAQFNYLGQQLKDLVS